MYGGTGGSRVLGRRRGAGGARRYRRRRPRPGESRGAGAPLGGGRPPNGAPAPRLSTGRGRRRRYRRAPPAPRRRPRTRDPPVPPYIVAAVYVPYRSTPGDVGWTVRQGSCRTAPVRGRPRSARRRGSLPCRPKRAPGFAARQSAPSRWSGQTPSWPASAVPVESARGLLEVGEEPGHGRWPGPSGDGRGEDPAHRFVLVVHAKQPDVSRRATYGQGRDECHAEPRRHAAELAGPLGGDDVDSRWEAGGQAGTQQGVFGRRRADDERVVRELRQPHRASPGQPVLARDRH